RRDGQRQRQPGAVLDQLVNSVRFVADTLGTEAGGEQLPGLGDAEQVQGDGVGAVDRDQTGEPVAAGDDRQTVWPGGQQGAYLLGVAGIVEQDQDALVGQEAAVQSDLRIEVGGDPVDRYM